MAEITPEQMNAASPEELDKIVETITEDNAGVDTPVVNTEPAPEKPDDQEPGEVGDAGAVAPETDSRGLEPIEYDKTDEDSYDENLAALAASYGMTEAEISAATNLEETVDVLAKRDREDALRERDTQQAAVETEQRQPAPETPTENPADDLDFAALQEEYGEDDPLVMHLKVLTDKMTGMEQSQATREQQANDYSLRSQVASFDASVDAMDESRYGRSGDAGNMTQSQYDHRSRLWDAAAFDAQRLEQQGKTVPPEAVLLQRAERFEFRDEFEQQIRSDERNGLRTQAGNRGPSGSRRKRNSAVPAIPFGEEVNHDSPGIKEIFENDVRRQAEGAT